MILARPWVLGVLAGLLLVYELVALIENQGNTISEIVWRISRHHPLVPFAFGVLAGHFFWQATTFWRNH